jgi:5-formyltetrahydrofolate cyclo-ligase
MGGIPLSKKEIRSRMKVQLSILGKDEYQLYSTEIENLFLCENIVQNSSVIGITISAFPEVYTKGIIQRLWDMGKSVVVPKCSPKDRSMKFYMIESFEQLEVVYMQLLEPDPLRTILVQPDDIDLLVVPGIVYNKSGYRIGYGGGYYDRFLKSYLNHTMSLAFESQLSDEVIPESFDLPVDQIITNKQVIHCKSNREEGIR